MGEYLTDYRKSLPPEKRRQYEQRYRAKIRLETIAAYGGKCKCCGETNEGFLTLDHVNNDGADHRRELGRKASLHLWAKNAGYPDTLQVLCYNCNCGRATNGGVCPHEALLRRQTVV